MYFTHISWLTSSFFLEYGTLYKFQELILTIAFDVLYTKRIIAKDFHRYKVSAFWSQNFSFQVYFKICIIFHSKSFYQEYFCFKSWKISLGNWNCLFKSESNYWHIFISDEIDCGSQNKVNSLLYMFGAHLKSVIIS